MTFLLWIGTVFAFSHSGGKMPFVWQHLKIIRGGLQKDLSHNLSMQILIISSPWALFESSLLIMILVSSIERSTSDIDLSVIKGKSDGNVLPLSTNEHCFIKKELKISLFSLKLLMNLLTWKSGDIRGIFLPFKRAFNSILQHLGLVDGSDNFFEIFLSHWNWACLACKASGLSSNWEFKIFRFRRLNKAFLSAKSVREDLCHYKWLLRAE